MSQVEFVAAPEREAETGLLGWVSFVLGKLRLDGITVRRTADGRHTLSFPARRDAAGRQHPYVRPLDDGVRREIEHQVFSALGFAETAAK
jgi:hypothetical protein